MPLKARSLPRCAGPLLVALLLLASTGCRSFFRHDRPGDPDRLTQAELAPYANRNLLEAIRTLRPRWFERTYSVPQRDQVTVVSVYVDNQRAGNAGILQSLTAGSVYAVRYYSPSEAQGRWGSGNLNGVIHVTTIPSIDP